MPDQTTDSDSDLIITENTSELRFPISTQNEVGNWLIFERKKYQKPDMFTNATYTNADGARRVVLPVPPELSKGYRAGWDEESLGIWGNFLRGTAGAAVSEVTNAYKSEKGLKSIFDNLRDMDLKQLTDTGLNVAQKIGRESINGGTALVKDALFNTDTFKTTGVFTGMARNPYKAILFQSPTFRSFQFRYKLMAKNYQEAVTIRDVIKEFQIGMSPDLDETFDNNIYTYPDLFILTLTDDSFLFKFLPCICEQISIDYHAEGTPIYINGPNGEKIPASVQINLEFRETEILTKKNFKEEGN